MFDVKPVNTDGSLNLEKINSLGKTVHIPKKRTVAPKAVRIANTSDIRREAVWQKKYPDNRAQQEFEFFPDRAEIVPERRVPEQEMYQTDWTPIPQSQPAPRNVEPPGFQEYGDVFFPAEEDSVSDNNFGGAREALDAYFENSVRENETLHEEEREEKFPEKNGPRIKSVSPFADFIGQRFGYGFSFAAALLIFSLTIPIFSFIQKGLEAKSEILSNSEQALGKVAEAKDNLLSGSFDKAASDFDESYALLSQAEKDISQIGGNFSEILRFIPGASKVATADYVVAAGQNLVLAGKYMSSSVQSLGGLGNPFNETKVSNQTALTDVFLNLRDGTGKANDELKEARENLAKVNVADLPSEMRPDFIKLKEKLPEVTASLDGFLGNSEVILDILGFNGPRKFLFLFQNNQEMRATGGFIGSYGILEISDGRVKKMFVDDIYNPDGQLKARVIPPEPIQKMSAVWTMHDANWFPDFPTSAEKLSWFYEKTGGPTVDGVIAVTPKLIQDLLAVTGPIEMPEYGITVDKDNFIEKTQYEVEIDYDKELNKPKKFIADLTPKVLDEVINTRNMAQMVKVLNIFNSLLKEKHLLIYSKNYNLQKLIANQGWSGEILASNKDYLSVINTNISGYKTDGVIDETINHSCELSGDGSITDTVTVTRKHNGGNEKYDWWNKVNADYVRIYVPEGSKLVEASGQTRESVSPPLDYQSLGFKKDPQVQAQEDSMTVDNASGTRIYIENHKTVFANWTYVSPGETVELKYKYKLPFRLSFDSLHHPVDTFSVLYQKQSGNPGSKLVSEIKLPQSYQTVWRWPENTSDDSGNFKMDTFLNTDRYLGIAVEKK